MKKSFADYPRTMMKYIVPKMAQKTSQEVNLSKKVVNNLKRMLRVRKVMNRRVVKNRKMKESKF